MTNIAIIFAGGVGQRLINNGNVPKQFIEINSKPIIIHTLEIFQKNKNIDKIYISVNEKYNKFTKDLVKKYNISKSAGVVDGGKTSQDSIYNALKIALAENPKNSIVLIHDGVRPNITQEVIDKNIEAVRKTGSAITCTNCTETILLSKNAINPLSVPNRKETFIAQAPQSFILSELFEAHENERKVNPDYVDIVDSCTLYTKQNKPTTLVNGNLGNIKITTKEDLYLLKAIFQYNAENNT